ncbi:hypothetical protein EYC84_002848 [Monilinia fructicola]|uniref:Uncharacterized protein n=1 Tax=Monilinia fructicola TaxID=38448 RepID=A0A5M9JMV4_MONFR|nr:hypothetical protein EYC84_002848 [Monilinia fructicola]
MSENEDLISSFASLLTIRCYSSASTAVALGGQAERHSLPPSPSHNIFYDYTSTALLSPSLYPSISIAQHLSRNKFSPTLCCIQKVVFLLYLLLRTTPPVVVLQYLLLRTTPSVVVLQHILFRTTPSVVVLQHLLFKNNSNTFLMLSFANHFYTFFCSRVKAAL